MITVRFTYKNVADIVEIQDISRIYYVKYISLDVISLYTNIIKSFVVNIIKQLNSLRE